MRSIDDVRLHYGGELKAFEAGEAQDCVGPRGYMGGITFFLEHLLNCLL